MRNYFDNRSKNENKPSGKMLIHTFGKGKSGLTKKKISIALVIIAGGIFTGHLMAGRYSSKTEIGSAGKSDGKAVQVVGSSDVETFSDSAEGKLEKGGIDSEGTHKLIRPGGESQTVYLTSSVLDMDGFVGKQVRVWGETYSSQKAGWFMDVGRVEVLKE